MMFNVCLRTDLGAAASIEDTWLSMPLSDNQDAFSLIILGFLGNYKHASAQSRLTFALRSLQCNLVQISN